VVGGTTDSSGTLPFGSFAAPHAVAYQWSTTIQPAWISRGARGRNPVLCARQLHAPGVRQHRVRERRIPVDRRRPHRARLRAERTRDRRDPRARHLGSGHTRRTGWSNAGTPPRTPTLLNLSLVSPALPDLARADLTPPGRTNGADLAAAPENTKGRTVRPAPSCRLSLSRGARYSIGSPRWWTPRGSSGSTKYSISRSSSSSSSDGCGGGGCGGGSSAGIRTFR
jgi:hypothetical protein